MCILTPYSLMGMEIKLYTRNTNTLHTYNSIPYRFSFFFLLQNSNKNMNK